MQTSVYIKNNDLIATIDSSIKGEVEYYFYILKNNSIISRIGWQKTNVCSFNLTESGIYSVRGFAQNSLQKLDSFSNTVTFFDATFDKKWNSIKENSYYEFKLNYHKSVEPHKDLIAIATREKSHIDMLKHKKIGDFNIFTNFETFGFSGTCFLENEFIFSQSDISSENLELINDNSCGDFTLMRITNELSITNDFFGNQKIYYYLNNGTLIASNRLHLIFKYIKQLNIKLQKNKKIINSLLISGSAQPFQQIFSNKLAFHNLFMLNVDQKISVTNKGICVQKKCISSYMGSSLPINKSEYDLLLKNGTKDLKNNFQNINKNQKFKNYLVDLTGGFDSRVVFSTINNFKKDNIYINSCKTESNPKDIQVAVTLNSIYGYKYDSLPYTKTFTSQKDLINKYYSSIFGTYFAYNPKIIYPSTFQNDDPLNITGFYGEITLRPYYSRNYLETMDSYIESNNFISEMMNRTWHDVINHNESLLDFFEVLTDTFDNISADSGIEKYDLLYLYFRNGLHCSDIYRFGGANNPRVSFIQSKNLFSLKNRCFDTLKQYPGLLQNDVISTLNPLNLLIDYSSEKDNIDLEKCKSMLSSIPEPILQANKINLTDNVGDPDNYRSKKKEKVIGEISKDVVDLDKLFIHALFSLTYKFNAIHEGLAKMIFVQASSGSNHVLMNKVIMLYLQFDELED